MKIDTNIPVNLKFTTKYPFDDMNEGDSLHFKNKVSRQRALTAFTKWKDRTGNQHLYARSQAVGPDDPAGAGFRMWVLSRAQLIAMEEGQKARDAEIVRIWSSDV